jgi:lysophospholipid acyltransferase (LPLAT)-like uncharacterized protein
MSQPLAEGIRHPQVRGGRQDGPASQPVNPQKKRRTWQIPLYYLFGWLVRILLWALFVTCRVQEFGRDAAEDHLKKHPGKGVIVATWHRGVLFLVYHFRGQGRVTMASSSKDGELAAQAAERHGWIVVRGSSSYRGFEALQELVRLFEGGRSGGMVVDAPRGPAQVSKPGIITAARLTGLAIMPIMWSADRCWRLRSWDRTIIPKPFARIVLVYGEALIRVPKEASREQLEACRLQLDAELNRLMHQTDRCFSPSGEPTPRP